MKLPVVNVTAGSMPASAARQRPPVMPLPDAEYPGRGNDREITILARVLAPAHFRLTFGGYAGAVELLVVRLESNRSGGLPVSAGDTLPVFSIREPVLERLRGLTRGGTVECRVTLCHDETIVCPGSGEMVTVPVAGMCHGMRAIGR